VDETKVDEIGEVAVRVKPERRLPCSRILEKSGGDRERFVAAIGTLTGDSGYARRRWLSLVRRARGRRFIRVAIDRPFEVERPARASRGDGIPVVASPDPDRGSIVKAFVKLREGAERSIALATELQEHCKRITAPYKYPGD